MSAGETVRVLLASGAGPEPEDEGGRARKAARRQWALERTAALRAAQRAMDDRCSKAVDRLDEAAFDRLFDAEQAKVDAIRAEMEAVAEKDRWPKHLHWGGV